MMPQIIQPDTCKFEDLAARFSLIPLDGKRPVEANWQRFCTTKREFRENDFDGKNAGICCGPASGVLVLDIDDPEAFEKLVAADQLVMPDTMTVKTGSGKPHYYFRYPEGEVEYGNRSLKHPVYSKITIFDIRGTGGQVVAPGSLHPETGEPYLFISDGEPADPPAWLLDFYNGQALDISVLWKTPLPHPQDRDFVVALNVSDEARDLILEGVPKGRRSEAVATVICSLIRGKYRDEIIRFIFDHYPIGEKYRDKGSGSAAWLRGEIERHRKFVGETGQQAPAPTHTANLSEDPEDRVQELNKKHAVVMVGGKFTILNEDWDPVFNRPNITFSSKADFIERYGNIQVPNPNAGRSLVKLGSYWLASQNRRQYDGITFSPGREHPTFYNLYRGFGVEPRPGDWSLFERHIREIIAGGVNEVAEYILNWLAQLFQNPGGWRPGVAIVLRGKRGTGKGVFVNNIGKMVGPHFLHVASQRMLTGQFNNHQKDALLVFCDEAFWAGDKGSEGILKALITEEEFMVEPKGKDPFPVMNHIRLIMASNEDWVVPAGLEERRFLVLDVSDRHMQDIPYFKAIGKQMDSGGREAMLHDLLNRDISNARLNDFPRTQALLDQIINSMPPVGKFVYEALKEGSFSTHQEKWEAVRTDDLYDRYKEFCTGLGVRFKAQKQEFGKQLKRYLPGMTKKRLPSASPRQKCANQPLRVPAAGGLPQRFRAASQDDH